MTFAFWEALWDITLVHGDLFMLHMLYEAEVGIPGVDLSHLSLNTIATILADDTFEVHFLK